MSYEHLTDYEKLEYIEERWYKVARDFIKAPDPVKREEAGTLSDILLDGYNEIVQDLGGFAVERAT